MDEMFLSVLSPFMIALKAEICNFYKLYVIFLLKL